MDDTVAPDKPLDSAVLSRLKHFSAMNKVKKMALHVCFYHFTLLSYVIVNQLGDYPFFSLSLKESNCNTFCIVFLGNNVHLMRHCANDLSGGKSVNVTHFLLV